MLRTRTDSAFHWDGEPVVCGHRRFTHLRKDGQRVAVPVCATPVAVVGLGAVFATYDGRVRLWDSSLGKPYWERRLDNAVYASPVADSARRAVVLATTGGRVCSLDLRGRPRWTAEAGGPVYATPTLLPDTELLVIAAFGGRCVGLRLDTGAKVFARELPRPWHARWGGSAADRDPYASPVTLDTGDVAVGCAEHVVCLTPDGVQRWHRDLGSSVRASLVAVHSEGSVAVTTVDGRCRFLDSRTGEERGAVVLGGKVVGSPALSGTVMAVGTQDGAGFGIDVRTHEVCWRVPGAAPRDHSSYTVTPSGGFAVTTARGNVLGLDRDDGRFLWETSQLLGLADHDPSLDVTPIVAPDGNMYCASYSGMAYRFRFRPRQDLP
ncbi:PQQ-binding-like beta-propeller repeat protein [Streptomyces sp. N2A]|uniref:outer membrane protein assembly factor BamB family protein n=1 Tax=Streptomyces sp. N2A TaxID=3073936 RepID=UPI00286FB4BC|nr:PQQ-binding-like beta-propeller repeat protein [Streptomyces sp. N2A]